MATAPSKPTTGGAAAKSGGGMTSLDPIALMHSAYAWLAAHWVLVALVVVPPLVFLLGWFLLRRVFVVVTPRKVAVRRAKKRIMQDGREFRLVCKTLETSGSRSRRIPPSSCGRILGGLPTASVLFLVTRPERGFLKWFRPQLNVIANHSIVSMQGEKLVVRALSMQQHGPVRWPNDDFADAETAAKWKKVLGEEAGPTTSTRGLVGLVAQWYVRIVRLHVILQESVEAIDNTMINLHAASTHDFARGPRPLVEALDHDPNLPPDPAQESVPRV